MSRLPSPLHVLSHLTLLALLAWLPACRIFKGRPAEMQINEVVLLGHLGAAHADSETFGLPELEQLLRRLAPTLVLADVPPGLYERAWEEFVRTGEVSDSYISANPVWTEVLFPMGLEGRIHVEPCSAWTASGAARRAELLEQWRSSRPRDTREAEAAVQRARRTLEREGLAQDPLGVQSRRYAEIVAEATSALEARFGRDLGPGGWSARVDADAELIEAVLDVWSGDGIRVVVLCDAWSLGPLRERLEAREDIELLEVEEALAAP